MATWPDPYLQPDKRVDCHLYTVAWIARHFGRLDANAEQVRDLREGRVDPDGKRLSEDHFLDGLADVERDSYWLHYGPPGNGFADVDEWWLGPKHRAWVEQHLAEGWVGYAHIHRVEEMAHAVALLEDRGDVGVLLMDPGVGIIVEPWSYFLSHGTGHPLSHRISSWYRRRPEE